MEPHSIQRIIVFVTITIFSLSLLAVLTGACRSPTIGFGSGGTLTVAMARQQVQSKLIASDYLDTNLDLMDVLVILVMALYQICSGLTTKKFFDYIQLPNFDIVADAAATFKELMTRHKSTVADFLSNYYEWFRERNPECEFANYYFSVSGAQSRDVLGSPNQITTGSTSKSQENDLKDFGSKCLNIDSSIVFLLYDICRFL
ncbi:putative MO25-like protein [Glycine soja]